MDLFLSLIRKGHIVYFVRHSKTNKPEAEDGMTVEQIDAARTLTTEGSAIAHQAGERLLDRSKVAAVFYSNARRCRETAEGLMGEAFDMTPSLPIDAAYPYSNECKGAAEINAAFAKLGNSTLSAYDEAGCADALDAYADGVFGSIEHEVNMARRELNGDVLIVTHGVCVAALARRLADALGHDLSELNGVTIEECGALLVDISGVVSIKPSTVTSTTITPVA